jgi:acyl-CoA dehydrogenase
MQQSREFFELSSKGSELKTELELFMDQYIYPNEGSYMSSEVPEAERWKIPSVLDDLKAKARERGLWNLFLPAVLSNLDYARLCEIMGRSFLAPEVFNCSAPDTGNMEVLDRYGSPEQKEKWLKPLLEGRIRSCFAMTEPDVASSDATNIQCSIVLDGDQYVVNGRKWWTSGALDPRCQIAILMGKTNPDALAHKQQSMILVPMDLPGVKVLRALRVFGFDDAPHGHAEVSFENVRVPQENLILGEGRGFEIAQGRLGPGRIHHCMRSIGIAERALEAMIARACDRVAFRSKLIEKGVIRQCIAKSRIEIDQARFLTLNAAHLMDTVGNKEARQQIAMIKVVAPNMALAVLDRAIQIYGGAGLCQDSFLAHAFAFQRALRLADGPDEVHLEAIARMEIERLARSSS